MKRFAVFFSLMLVFVIAASLVVWWIGPRMISLAVFDAQRDQPYLLLNLSRSADDEHHTSRYREPLAGLIASEGGVALSGYRLVHLMQGEQADQWSYLDLFHMSRAQDVAQVMTSSPFRVLRRQLPGFASLQLGQYMQQPPHWGKVIAVWMVRDQAQIDALAAIKEQLELGMGRLVWQAQVDVLNEDDAFDRIMVVAFDSQAQAWAWLRHPKVTMARSLANARARQLALAVYEREADSRYPAGPS